MKSDVRPCSSLILAGLCLNALLLGGCSSRQGRHPMRSGRRHSTSRRSPSRSASRSGLTGERLPKSARADFPSFDGDSFFVSIPPTLTGAQKSAEVFAGVVSPVLRAVGFERKLEEFGVPSGEGTRQPHPTCRDLRVWCVTKSLIPVSSAICGPRNHPHRSAIGHCRACFPNGDGITRPTQSGPGTPALRVLFPAACRRCADRTCRRPCRSLGGRDNNRRAWLGAESVCRHQRANAPCASGGRHRA